MTDFSKPFSNLPPEQQAIRAKCFHPSGTFVEFPMEDVETSIPPRFEKIVAQYPHRIAVKSATQALTYDQLNRAANRLARVILARRGGVQEPVALFLENSLPLIIAHLAVLKAGKIAMQVDPFVPVPRIAHIMTDSQVAVVLTNTKTNSVAHNWVSKGHNLYNIDKTDGDISDENLNLSISPDAYAGIGYTSGSTGKAKGTLKSHSSTLHAVMNFSNSCHVSADDRLILVGRAPAGKFLFSGLLNGARLCLFDLRTEGLLHLADRLIQDEITILMTLPTAFRHFLSSVTTQKSFAKLRLIRFSGEPTVKRDIELYKAHVNNDCLLVNAYAAQETDDICLYFMDKNSVISGNRVPVGYPRKNTNVYVIDDLGNKLSHDQPGEIVVESSFLPPGYLEKADDAGEHGVLTRKEAAKQRYQTGDIGLMLEDGCLVLLGRKDSQVKIRSYRVDIGEVEATLADHPGVKEASVVARETPSGDIILLGYVASHDEQALTVTALRSFLAERLPEYMIPAVFTILSKLPVTATGKVDRRALPDPSKARPNFATPFVEPRTAVEKELALIWSEIISVQKIGAHDNFFDLGGHSLAAMRVVSKVIQTFHLELPIKALFESPTVAEMAAVIEHHQSKQASEETLNRMLSEIEAMTEDEARKQLAGQSAKESSEDRHG